MTARLGDRVLFVLFTLIAGLGLADILEVWKWL